MPRRKVLGTDPLSWIKPTIQEEHNKLSRDNKDQNRNFNEARQSETGREKTSERPKFETYEVLLTLRLTEDQLEFLSKLEREIMKKRSRDNRKERITKNSIIRAVIDVIKDLDIDTAEIKDEEELIRRFKQVFEAIHKISV